MAKEAEKPTIYVFGSKLEKAILVPEIPINVRNNCQSGKWEMGETDYGSKVSMTVLKFSKFFGSLGQTHNTMFGQLWFVAESGELPQGVLLVTYIKTRSLASFYRMVASVQARGVEPATGIFIPEFVKHSGSKPDENGVFKPTNYYSLKWQWKERTDWTVVEQAAAVLAEPGNQARLIDYDGTRKMTCLDKLPPHQVEALISGSQSTSLSRDQKPAALPEGQPSEPQSKPPKLEDYVDVKQA
mgnify:CR=1 FL=1